MFTAWRLTLLVGRCEWPRWRSGTRCMWTTPSTLTPSRPRRKCSMRSRTCPSALAWGRIPEMPSNSCARSKWSRPGPGHPSSPWSSRTATLRGEVVYRCSCNKWLLGLFTSLFSWNAVEFTEVNFSPTWLGMASMLLCIQNPQTHLFPLPVWCSLVNDAHAHDLWSLNLCRTEYTKQQAALARAENITMFALGVGKAVKEQELLNIAGDPSRVLRADSYSELDEEKRKELTKQTCVCEFKHGRGWVGGNGELLSYFSC